MIWLWILLIASCLMGGIIFCVKVFHVTILLKRRRLNEELNEGLKVVLLLDKIHHLLMRRGETIFSKAGITFQQYLTLESMELLPDPATQIDLAGLMGQSPNNIATMVDRLEKLELVRRNKDLPDKREIRLELTQKGKEALSRTEKNFSEVLQLLPADLQEAIIFLDDLQSSF